MSKGPAEAVGQAEGLRAPREPAPSTSADLGYNPGWATLARAGAHGSRPHVQGGNLRRVCSGAVIVGVAVSGAASPRGRPRAGAQIYPRPQAAPRRSTGSASSRVLEALGPRVARLSSRDAARARPCSTGDCLLFRRDRDPCGRGASSCWRARTVRTAHHRPSSAWGRAGICSLTRFRSYPTQRCSLCTPGPQRCDWS